MRARPIHALVTFACCTLAAGACAHEERRAPASPPVSNEPAPVPMSVPPQYVIADPSSRAGSVVVSLGRPGVHGVVVDKRRVVVGQGEARVASDTTSEPIVGASKLPSRFGGGFLFWTVHTLYRSGTFDGELLPIAHVPDPIEMVAFAPKSLFVRTHNGERWGIALPSGDRAPIVPLGVADIEALDDGRAIGINDQGAVFTSSDHGAHWVDATAQVRSSPSKVEIIGSDLWLFESSGSALRLEADGNLSQVDKPPADAATELRPRDPRWRGTDSPLRTVFRAGASVDDSTAIVIDSGDLVRIDVHSGDVLSVIPGHLPPDAQCEALPVPGDILFACITSRSGANAIVVSRTLSSEPPVVEQTFVGGGQFFASDDGGLAYSGACQGVPPGAAGTQTVCVRTPGARWEERDLSGFASDAGPSDVSVARWIPRPDGRVVAIVAEPTPGIYDPQLGTFQPISEEAREVVGQGVTMPPPAGKYARIVRTKRSAGTGIVDATWSFGSGGTLRGWQRHGESVEISEEGKLRRSPWAFEVIFAGPMGLGRSKEGRLYQSMDHGASWNEVAVPPSGEALELASCTSAGCDLGAFYRVGWAERPPRIDSPKTSAPPAPAARRTRGLELSCRPQAAVASKILPRTSDSPEDLGLGANRLPVANEKNEWGYVRNTALRTIVNPLREVGGNDSDAMPSLRAIFSGFGTTRDGDVITVTGPNKNALALRRGVAYVAPFDPLGRVIRTGIAMSDVVAAGRRAGMTTGEILAEDLTEIGAVITLTAADPAAPSDIAIHNVDNGLLTLVHGERVRVAVRPSQNSASIVSGVVLGAGAEEAAFLEVESSGASHVFKVGSGGVSDLFDVSWSANESYYPANPDALAIGPKGELAILRTPSGSDPASALDPALLLAQGTPATALAPWSELKLADDPVCRAESGGYRAVLQLIAPWIRVTTPELRVEDAPMIARVRWTPKRVCLEGFEVRLPSVALRFPQAGSFESGTLGTWLVGKGSSFARVAVADGVEWRQPLECTVVTAGP